MLNLAVFLGMKVIVPETGSVDYLAAALALITFSGFWKWNWPIHCVVLAGGIVGVSWKLVG